MSEKYFRFKQFIINQENVAMKVGTDAVILGAWVNPQNAKKILDVGSGTGIIALMLAQKSNAVIDAVEIDKDSYLQAKENFENSKWRKRINVYNESFQEYSKKISFKYDIIVSNPPYFINSYKSVSEEKNKAKHNVNLSFDELIKYSSNILKPSGMLYLIIPSDSLQKVVLMAEEEKLYCNEVLNVFPKPRSKAKRAVLKLEFVKKKLIEEKLTVENNERHDYTDEYKNLTKVFYLFL
ncbi:MAG: methyltransferase [Bacteroidales bacterium]|nr:methyltransferase [Bacteroidales bacterium]